MSGTTQRMLIHNGPEVVDYSTPNTAAIFSAASTWELNVKDFGAVCDNTADDYPAIQAAIDQAQIRGGSVSVFIPAGGCRISQSIKITKVGVHLRGEGSANSPQTYGTIIQPHASMTSGALLYLPSAANGGQTWYHNVRIEGIDFRGGPSHGLWLEGGVGEGFWLHDVQAHSNTGDGIRCDGGGTPMFIGNLNSHNNGGEGFYLKNFPNIAEIASLSGDNNGGALLRVEALDRSAVVKIASLKVERSVAGKHDTPVSLIDLNGGKVIVQNARFSHSTSLANSPASAVKQTRTATTKAIGHVAVHAIGLTSWPSNIAPQWPNFYENVVTGETVSWETVLTGGMATMPTTIARAAEGTELDLVISAKVAIAQTTIPHGLATTPVVKTIVPNADARVWQSAAADATNVYLTASSACTCTIVLGGETARVIPLVQTQYDTFTGADNTNVVSSHAPDVGAAWSSSGTYTIQSNRARANTNFTQLYKDVAAADARIKVSVHTGDDGASARYGGVMFRRVDTNNFWYAIVNRAGSGGADALQLFRVDANAHTQVVYRTITTAANTAYLLEVLVSGKWAYVWLDGTYYFRWYVGDLGPAATAHGAYTVQRGSGPVFLSFDSAEILIP